MRAMMSTSAISTTLSSEGISSGVIDHPHCCSIASADGRLPLHLLVNRDAPSLLALKEVVEV